MTLAPPDRSADRVSSLAARPEDVWRPVQYLGSKLRALPAVTSQIAELTSEGVVWDAFTGSSVVAQAVAGAGLDVWATDTQRSSAIFAEALLGVDASPGAAVGLAQAVAGLFTAAHPDEARWARYLSAEDELLAERDYDGLVALYGGLPQRWRSAERWSECAPLASTFAGTYLSLRQAMALDAARHELRERRVAGEVDRWTYAAALTSLCHAASEAVHSAGKHFAQPIQPAFEGAANYGFVRGRSLRDRAVVIETKAVDAAANIAQAVHLDGNHAAGATDVLTVDASQLQAQGVTVVYADPPYTAQQYSRFYHVLETLVDGFSAPIQSVRGSTPKGLYPAERYLSPFCSRRQAPAAFEQLIRTSREAGAHLMLSYSTTGSESGNQRTVGEAELLSMVAAGYGRENVSIVDLDYGYRQFNHESRRTETSGTNEILIVGTAS